VLADQDAPTAVLPVDDSDARTAEFSVDFTHTTMSLARVVEAPAPVEKTEARAPRRRHLRIDLTVFGAFILIALWIVGPYWSGGRVSSSDASDQAFFEWMLAHGAQVLTHFDSPLFTTQMNVPDGVNLMANTSILALSIPMAPITLLFGPGVAYALLLTLGLAGTAAAWYFVLSRHVVRSTSAAVLGGLLAGFGPAMIAHANGHPNIISQFLVPFLAWRVLRMREPGRVLRNGIAVGLLVVAQVFINEEILFITAIGMAILLVCLAVAHRRTVRADIRPFFTAGGVAVLVAVTLLAYPLWQQFFGPGSYHGLNADLQEYGTDLGAFGAFGSHTLVGSLTNNARLAPNPVEQNGFFGWPMILTFIVGMYWLRKRPLAIGLGITGVLLATFSLGKHLIIDGSHKPVELPWYWLSRLPIFDSVVPTRMSLLVLPVLAVIIALAHDHVLASYGRRTRDAVTSARSTRLIWPKIAWLSLIIVALGTVLPAQASTEAATPTPSFIASGLWRKYVTADQTIVPVPLPQEGDVESLFWAANNDLAIQLPRGYFLGPDPAHEKIAIFGAPDRHTSILLEKVETANKAAVVHATDRKDAVADLRYWHAAVVVQVPGGKSDKALRATLTDLLGFKPKYSGGVWVWDVRHLLAGKRSILG
jgi:hypothetical protein